MNIKLSKEQFKKFLSMGLCPTSFGIEKGIDHCFGNMDKQRCRKCWEDGVNANNALVEMPARDKFPLVMETIKLPVRYRSMDQVIVDDQEHEVLEIKGWEYIQNMSNPNSRHNQIGKMIVHLLNRER